MRQAWGLSVGPRPRASSMRKVEKAMAVERPSKVGASWAGNGWGSTSTTFNPAWAAVIGVRRAHGAVVAPSRRAVQWRGRRTSYDRTCPAKTGPGAGLVNSLLTLPG